jgi:hypothetical protein
LTAAYQKKSATAEMPLLTISIYKIDCLSLAIAGEKAET